MGFTETFVPCLPVVHHRHSRHESLDVQWLRTELLEGLSAAVAQATSPPLAEVMLEAKEAADAETAHGAQEVQGEKAVGAKGAGTSSSKGHKNKGKGGKKRR